MVQDDESTRTEVEMVEIAADQVVKEVGELLDSIADQRSELIGRLSQE